MLIAVLVVTLAETAKAQDLDSATFISMNETEQPLRDVLAKFERQGNVTFDVQWIVPRREELLSKEVTINFENKPFWEASLHSESQLAKRIAAIGKRSAKKVARESR
jgi:hypothetical protein